MQARGQRKTVSGGFSNSETLEMNDAWDINHVRSHFPALQRQLGGQPVAFFDGPAGSQVPQRVADAVTSYLVHTNSNRGMPSATAQESDAILERAHETFADFLNADEPESIIFGSNMTTMTLAVSRTLATTWQPGDEILLSRLDHDANVTPWILAAKDAGATVHHIDLNPTDWTLNLDDFHSKLSNRTKLVAVGYASNATGTINPVKAMTAAAKAVGALTFIDAVHYAPHGRIDVQDIDCDFLACSAYKFFGPHIGIMYGRGDLLNSLRPFKLRPSTDRLPGKWMTGTQNHEGIAGAAAAVEYLASLNLISDRNDCNESNGSDLSAKLDRVFGRIKDYEQSLSSLFIEGIKSIGGFSVHGIQDLQLFEHRLPTFSMTHASRPNFELAKAMAREGIFAWAGNHYALPFTEAAGLEPDGTLRIGALHYNSTTEIQRLIDCLRRLA